MQPIHIPDDWDDWDDNGLITFETFCQLFALPQRTVRDWRRRGCGPAWSKFEGCGRLYVTVGEARRFLSSGTTSDGPDDDSDDDLDDED